MTIGPIALLLPFASPARAQIVASTEPLARQLVQIIQHQLPATPESIAATIVTGMSDSDPRTREAALAAVVSRAAGPHYDRTEPVRRDWFLDREYIQRLRPTVVAALTDPVESVRLQAVASLVSLDFDVIAPAQGISKGTEEILIRHFGADSSAQVRSNIVAGLATDPAAASPQVQALITAAFRDADPRVRHAATYAAGKCGSQIAMSLLLERLHDTDTRVRAQAATALARYGATAAVHRSEVEAVLRQETDAQVRRMLEITLLNIR